MNRGSDQDHEPRQRGELHDGDGKHEVEDSRMAEAEIINSQSPLIESDSPATRCSKLLGLGNAHEMESPAAS